MTYWKLQEIARPERWSAKALADKTGLAYNTVWGIWTNKTQYAHLRTLAKLADVLGVAPGDLIGCKGTDDNGRSE